MTVGVRFGVSRNALDIFQGGDRTGQQFECSSSIKPPKKLGKNKAGGNNANEFPMYIRRKFSTCSRFFLREGAGALPALRPPVTWRSPLPIHAESFLLRNASSLNSVQRSLRLIQFIDIRFPANSRLRSAPSVNPACAAPRGKQRRARFRAPSGFGGGQRLSAPVSQQ